MRQEPRRPSAPFPGRSTLVLAAAAAFVAAGCVERRLVVRTDPPGADVRVGGFPVGISPATWTFAHYGTVRVEATAAGRLPAVMPVELDMPWYQWFPLDFVADNLLPWTIVDEREVTLSLPPRPRPESDEEIGRARAEAERIRAAAESVHRAGGLPGTTPPR